MKRGAAIGPSDSRTSCSTAGKNSGRSIHQLVHQRSGKEWDGAGEGNESQGVRSVQRALDILARQTWEIPDEMKQLMRDLGNRRREAVNLYVLRDV